jgi:hypothetical protein
MAGETTKVVRAGLERLCKDFALRVSHSGFVRTRKMLWTRRHRYTVDFMHFHRHGSSYGAPINFSVSTRIHFGIRVLNDPYEGMVLNGPDSDSAGLATPPYHLRFNAKSGSTYERCLDDLVRVVADFGEPWFEKFRSPRVAVAGSGITASTGREAIYLGRRRWPHGV